jgi:hypothetical protein
MLGTITSPDVKGFMLPVKNEETLIPDTIFSRPPWFPVRINTKICVPTGDIDNPTEWMDEDDWEGEMPEVGVLFLDEWGQAEEDVKKPAAELLLNGNVGNWKLPKGWRVVAATNRVIDRSGVLRELMFIENRRCLLEITPSLFCFLDWVETQRGFMRPHYMTVAFAQNHPNIIFGDKVPDTSGPFPTSRSLVKMDRDLRAIRSDDEEARNVLPMDDIAREVATGWIGNAGPQYFSYLKYADQLPEIADIVRNPATAKLPPGQDGQMVATYKLVEHLTEENAGVFLKYIMRMSSEMGIHAVNVLKKDTLRAKILFPLEEYREFQMRHKDTLLAAAS